MFIKIPQLSALVWAQLAHHSCDIVVLLTDVLRRVLANNVAFFANPKVVLALVRIVYLLSQPRNLSLDPAESFIVFIVRYEKRLITSFHVIVFLI